MYRRSFLAVLALMFMVLACSPGLLSKKAQALSTSEWQAGRIIDDLTFTNADAMSVSQIQVFLNNLVPNCDTYGTQPATEWGRSDLTHAQYATQVKGWPGPPYVCLKNYYEVPKAQMGPGVPDNSYNHNGNAPSGSISAAQMIYNAAKQYRISPKVLLIKLRSESSGPLTNDSWPLQNQYTYAMGAHCPDTGPNHAANCDPNYAGFSIQISEAASLLRWYLDNMNQPWYPYKKIGINNIQYNPDTSCGSSNVNVTTSATAALYTYTPYQPNAAALAAGYGTAPPCGAYGNRNFWLYYNDWFGSTKNQFGNVPSTQSTYATWPCNIGNYDSSYVGRLYQPDSGEYFYTRSATEACGALKYGYIWDGLTMQNAAGPNAIPVFRLNGPTGHVFTADSSVRSNALSSGYTDEGVAFYAYASAQGSNTLPVYELTNGASSTLFTSAGAEGQYFVQNYGYQSEGVAFYTPALNTSPQPVFRESKNNGERFYTTSSVEASNSQVYGFHSEGITTYDDTMPDVSNLPVYRLTNSYGHFYTTSRVERDSAVINYGYIDEGIGFYAPSSSYPGVIAVNRLTDYRYGFRFFTSSPTETDNATKLYTYTFEGTGWYGYSH